MYNPVPTTIKQGTNYMTQADTVLKHMMHTGSISIREAMDDYNISGGGLTKIISRLRHENKVNIYREFRKHPMTKTRYARYSLVRGVALASA